MKRKEKSKMPTTNRKTATRLLLINWAKFQKTIIRLDGSVFLTGVNSSGKSTILDAITFMLTGNTSFNIMASKGSGDDRSVLKYIRGDADDNGPDHCLRKGEVVSYIAMEFDDPLAGAPLVVGVNIEAADETKETHMWFASKDTQLEDIGFCKEENGKLYVTPRCQLTVKGQRVKVSEFFMRYEKGTAQILRALGLRCEVDKYRKKRGFWHNRG